MCERLKIIFFLCAALSFRFPLFSGYCSQPSQVSIRGELLYFFPAFNDTSFVINGSGTDGSGNPTPNGKRINNPGWYNFGFRLEGDYGFYNSCVDFGLRFTHLSTNSEKTVSNHDTPAQLWPTLIIPNLPNVSQPFSGTASSNIRIMYHKAEALFDEHTWDCSCWHFTLREALEWSYIRYHEIVRYVAATNFEKIQFHAHTKGLGPQLGVIVQGDPWHIFEWYPRGLSFKLMTTASLLPVNSKAKLKARDILSADNKITQSSEWRLITEWSLDFGIQYTYCCRSFLASLELGYEMTSYIRGTSQLIFDEAASPGHSFNQYSDFYVHGLRLALEVAF